MKIKKLLIILFIIILLSLSLIISLVTISFQFNSPTYIILENSIVFKIIKGENLNGIAERLEENKLIRSSLFLKILSRVSSTEKAFSAGNFLIEKGSTTIDIHNHLVDGEQIQIKITIPEGWSKTRLAEYFEQNGLSTKEDILAAIKSEELLKKYNIDADSLEGYLFPDTYYYSITNSAETIVEKLIKNFFLTVESIYSPYKQLTNKKLHKKVILASIVEREYRIENEAPLIASVFYNRLEANYRLESCATIEYIITEIQNKPHPKYITNDDQQVISPYNTYKTGGLPPGPIANPGRIALQAVFYPADTDYWFFLVKDSELGEHYFSENYSDHVQAKIYYLKGQETIP